jgi:hypothetical protein
LPAAQLGSASSAFGLTATEWTAIAAAAQACAAIGAIALLVVTAVSGRRAKDAIQASLQLAGHTEQLVAVTKEAQSLAVRPVIELRRDIPANRLLVMNSGNGPLLEPRVVTANGDGDASPLRLNSGGVFVEVGALRPGGQAFVGLEPGAGALELTLVGRTLVGEQIKWAVAAEAGDRTILAVPQAAEGSND